MSETDARRLLADSDHAVLCLQNPGGGGYGVPINYVWDEKDTIYMHSASDGHKLRCVRACPQASLVVTGAAQVLPPLFSTAYESVVAQGVVEIVEDAGEKRQALELLIRKLTPGEVERGLQYIDRALESTAVLRLRISRFCGKAHRPHTGSPA